MENKFIFIIVYYDWDSVVKYKTIETTSLKEGLEKCEKEIDEYTTPFFNVNIFNEKGERILPMVQYKTLLLVKDYLK